MRTLGNWKGVALTYLKQYEEALPAYDRALALDPDYEAAWYNKSEILRTLGRTVEADAARQRADELPKEE
jgi:tetratricopeptide (TPR) repeat protein